jgi:hypothetical protein
MVPLIEIEMADYAVNRQTNQTDEIQGHVS